MEDAVEGEAQKAGRGEKSVHAELGKLYERLSGRQVL